MTHLSKHTIEQSFCKWLNTVIALPRKTVFLRAGQENPNARQQYGTVQVTYCDPKGITSRQSFLSDGNCQEVLSSQKKYHVQLQVYNDEQEAACVDILSIVELNSRASISHEYFTLLGIGITHCGKIKDFEVEVAQKLQQRAVMDIYITVKQTITTLVQGSVEQPIKVNDNPASINFNINRGN